MTNTHVLQGQAYQFTHYLFVSRVYQLSTEEEHPSKRLKSDGVCAFHPEDDEITKVGSMR